MTTTTKTRYTDWQRYRQSQGFGGQGGSQAATRRFSPGPGRKNNDFISDFNQNQNSRPDYVEPFLRYQVDPPEFSLGMGHEQQHDYRTALRTTACPTIPTSATIAGTCVRGLKNHRRAPG